MSRDPLLVERLEGVLEALERITRRFAGIRTPEDLVDNPEGQDRLDAICRVLAAVFAGTIYRYSRNDIPVLIDTVHAMLKDLADHSTR